MKRHLSFFVIACLAVSTSSALAQSKPKAALKEEKPKAAKPTGSCTITVYGISPTCTSPMTQDACNASAKKVGGVADWKDGKSC